MDDDKYCFRECDVDMEAVRKICAGKTVEELDAEFEAFKEEFRKQHGVTPSEKSENLVETDEAVSE